jgi:hypothetical protein
MHIVIVSAVSVGISPIITFGAVGIHGATVMGIQGAGAPTIFAAMTIGFVGALQIAKGTTLTIGANAIMFAAGRQSVSVIEMGSTINVEGAAPKVHIVIAPIDTVGPAIFYPFFILAYRVLTFETIFF